MPKWIGLGVVLAAMGVGSWVWSMDQHVRSSAEIHDNLTKNQTALQEDVRQIEIDRAIVERDARIKACLEAGNAWDYCVLEADKDVE